MLQEILLAIHGGISGSQKSRRQRLASIVFSSSPAPHGHHRVQTLGLCLQIKDLCIENSSNTYSPS